jgi:hypothetical protein
MELYRFFSEKRKACHGKKSGNNGPRNLNTVNNYHTYAEKTHYGSIKQCCAYICKGKIVPL